VFDFVSAFSQKYIKELFIQLLQQISVTKHCENIVQSIKEGKEQISPDISLLS
jgi:hypothetical protein